MESKKIVYWNDIPAPYMVDRFNAVAARGRFQFEAWFSHRNTSSRSWQIDEAGWKFAYRYLPTMSIFNRKIAIPTPLAEKQTPDLLVSLFADPSFVAGWSIARARRVSTAFWVEATFDDWPWIHRRYWKDIVRCQMFKRTNGIITVGSDGKAYAERYGASASKIHFARHSINVDHFRLMSKGCNSEKQAIREKLGLRGVTFIYVGRLIPLKGVRYLLEAFVRVSKSLGGEVSMLIVGDGPERGAIESLCSYYELENVKLVGFQEEASLPTFYGASDIFVFPSLGDTYGLVIDEAMACGLPVICSDAVAELSCRLLEGTNGLTFAAGNTDALADAMIRLARNAELRQAMGQLSSALIDGNTPERWAEDFEAAVIKILESGSCPSESDHSFHKEY